MEKYDLTTDEGIEAFNNRTPVNTDGTPYDEAEDAKYIKKLLNVPTNIFELLDSKITNMFKR